MIPNNAGWSSLEARRAHNPEVTGSNPVPAIHYFWSKAKRPDDSGAIFLLHAQLAQLVEQRTENPRVSGSIPELGSLMKKDSRKRVLFYFSKRKVENKLKEIFKVGFKKNAYKNKFEEICNKI